EWHSRLCGSRTGVASSVVVGAPSGSRQLSRCFHRFGAKRHWPRILPKTRHALSVERELGGHSSRRDRTCLGRCVGKAVWHEALACAQEVVFKALCTASNAFSADALSRSRL